MANYLYQGENLDDKRVPESQTQRTLYIDGLLTADSLIPDLNEALNHYDIRREYSYQIGEALAMARDGGLLAEIGKEVVRGQENLPGLGKGKILSRPVTDGLTKESEDLGFAIVEMLLECKTALSNNYVLHEGRVCYMLPVGVNALIAAKDPINKLYGGVASITDANLTRIAGFDIVECLSLTIGGVTKTDNGTPDGLIQGTGHILPSEYQNNCVFLVAHRTTVGTLTLKSFSLEHVRRINY